MTVADQLIAWGIRFSQVSYTIRFRFNSVTEDLRFAATGTDLSPTTDYFVIGDGQSNDLIDLLEKALEDHTQSPSLVGTLQSTWVVRIAETIGSTNMQLLWDHANTTLDKAIFGFAGDTAETFPLDGTLLPQTLWRPEKPEMNGRGKEQSVIAGGIVTASGAQRTSYFGAGPDQRKLRFERLSPSKAKKSSVSATEPFGSIEDAWKLSMARGQRFRVYDDETNLATNAYEEYRAQPTSGKIWEPDPQYPSGLYATEFMGRAV